MRGAHSEGGHCCCQAFMQRTPTLSASWVPAADRRRPHFLLAEPTPASTFRGKLTKHKEEMFQKAQDIRTAKFPIPRTLRAHTAIVKRPHVLESIRLCTWGQLPSGRQWPFLPGPILIPAPHLVDCQCHLSPPSRLVCFRIWLHL